MSPFAIDEFVHVAPPRIAIALIAARIRIRTLRIRLAPAIARARHAGRVIAPWIAAAAFVLGYLLVCGYLDRQDLADENSRLKTERAALRLEKAELESMIAELHASRTQKLVYLIEADTTTEAKEKLARMAMMVAREHFDLIQEKK